MRLAPVVLIASGVVAGCGVASGTAQRTADQSVTHGVACSFAVDYRSLAQLRHAATAVAVVEPTGGVGARRIAGLTCDDARVRVVERVAGRRLPAAFVIEDVADPRIAGSAGCGPLLTKGNAYLLYLTPVRRRHGGPATPGRFDVVGGPMGTFAHHGTALPGLRERSFVRQQPDLAVPAEADLNGAGAGVVAAPGAPPPPTCALCTAYSHQKRVGRTRSRPYGVNFTVITSPSATA